MNYTVDISPAGKEELWNYIEGSAEFGDDVAVSILDSFDNCVSSLEENPYCGQKKAPFLPDKYHIMRLWKHYWLIYQVCDSLKTVKIEYVIDDRQNYSSFIK